MGRTLSATDPNAGVATFSSASGFNAGDYVYQTNSGYGAVPNNALTSGNFDFSGVTSTVAPSDTTYLSNLNYVEIIGGSSGGEVAAKLNNGNIVLAYVKSPYNAGNGTPYFKIVDSSGAVVVAETAAAGAASVGSMMTVAVCVLPNGNFVLCYTGYISGNTNYYPAYRIFSETGTAVTSSIVDTTVSYNDADTTCIFKVKPRSDNSFILMYTQDNGNIRMKAANASGFNASFNGGTGYINIGLQSGTYQIADFCINGSDGIVTAEMPNSSVARIGTYSSTGVFGGYNSMTSSGFITAVACAQLPNGNTVVMYQGGSGGSDYGIYAYTWNGTTLSAATKIVTLTSYSVNTRTMLVCKAQGASNNYVVMYAHPDTDGSLAYYVFNSSGVSVSGSSPRKIPAIAFPLGGWLQVSLLDIGSSTRAYMSARSNCNSGANGLNRAPAGIFYFSYDATSYLLSQPRTVSANWGAQGPIATNGYARSASTAASAAFYVASTGSYTANVAAGTTLIAKQTLATSAASVIGATPLQGGNFAVGYISSASPYPLTVKVFDQNGALLTSSVVASATFGGALVLAPFSNGTFAALYANSSSDARLSFKILNSSLAELYSGDITTSAYQLSGGYPNFGFAAASFGDGSNIAIAYNDSNPYMYVKLLSSGGVVNAPSSGSSIAGNNYSPQVVGHRSGSFFVMKRDNTVYYGVTYYQTGASTWDAGGGFVNITNSNNGSYYGNNSPVPAPGNAAIGLAVGTQNWQISGCEPAFYGANYWVNNSGGTVLDSTDFSYTNRTAVGYTAGGTGVAVGFTSGGVMKYARLSVGSESDWANWKGATYTPIGISGSITGRPPVVIPHLEGSCIVGYIESATNYPCFFAPVVSPFTVTKTLTAGVDISATTLSLSPQTGYVLQGVSVTAASAGGAGLVQTRGSANLSSSYSASTPATNFDFRNPTTTGVRGSVSGRAVNLES